VKTSLCTWLPFEFTQISPSHLAAAAKIHLLSTVTARSALTHFHLSPPSLCVTLARLLTHALSHAHNLIMEKERSSTDLSVDKPWLRFIDFDTPDISRTSTPITPNRPVMDILPSSHSLTASEHDSATKSDDSHLSNPKRGSILNRKRELSGLSTSFSSNLGRKGSPGGPGRRDCSGGSIKAIVAWIESSKASTDTNITDQKSQMRRESLRKEASAVEPSPSAHSQPSPGPGTVHPGAENYSLTLLKYQKYFNHRPLSRCLDDIEENQNTEAATAAQEKPESVMKIAESETREATTEDKEGVVDPPEVGVQGVEQQGMANTESREPTAPKRTRAEAQAFWDGVRAYLHIDDEELEAMSTPVPALAVDSQGMQQRGRDSSQSYESRWVMMDSPGDIELTAEQFPQGHESVCNSLTSSIYSTTTTIDRFSVSKGRSLVSVDEELSQSNAFLGKGEPESTELAAEEPTPPIPPRSALRSRPPTVFGPVPVRPARPQSLGNPSPAPNRVFMLNAVDEESDSALFPAPLRPRRTTAEETPSKGSGRSGPVTVWPAIKNAIARAPFRRPGRADSGADTAPVKPVPSHPPDLPYLEEGWI
jgi:hypothetical protein